MTLKATSTARSSQPKPTFQTFKHTLAILTLPTKSTDRIANEAILSTCMAHTSDKLSIVLRCRDDVTPHLHDLRGYVGEIYSLAWDVVLNLKEQQSGDLLNVIVYPHNLPNAAAEAWITHREDLECICSHDSIIGWETTESMGSGRDYDKIKGSGLGGLDQFVEAVNSDRKVRKLKHVVSLPVDEWPQAIWTDENVVFLEDGDGRDNDKSRMSNVNAVESEEEPDLNCGLISGYRIPSSSLYNSVAVGGTFDGMHYGHRKLLTLAVSSVLPNTGRLTIGITTDEMLQQKEYSELIPKLSDRIKGVRNFVDTLAPGMKNRVKIVPILDKFGPPGAANDSDVYHEKNDYDALVLSHETLETGRMLNKHRVQVLGMPPLKLLCTRRTEAYGMSSTTLRRIKHQQEVMETCDMDGSI
jgi:Predicted nucleotidyltransferase